MAELSRLQDGDPVRWLGPILAAIATFEAEDPDFAGPRADLARAKAYAEAGSPELASLMPALLADTNRLGAGDLYTLSGLVRAGQGTRTDPARADALLLEAAFAGHPDALLDLTARGLRGTAPPEWDVDPEIAVTIAFGALVGALDEGVCTGIERVARAYLRGDVVAPMPEVAAAWFGVLSDMGDPSGDWEIARLHMDPPRGFARDVNVLLTRLERAADAGLRPAMTALAAILETGALAPRDIAKARSLRERAAEAGGAGDRVQLARILLDAPDASEADRDLALTLLSTAVERGEASFSARAALAQGLLDRDGIWGGRDAALAVLEPATATLDGERLELMAKLILADVETEERFAAAEAALVEAVTVHANDRSAQTLADALLCRTPGAPRIEEARYWSGVLTASCGSIAAQDLLRPHVALSPLMLARAQSEALDGSPAALASLAAYLTSRGDSQRAAFVTALGAQRGEVLVARAELALEGEQDRAQIEARALLEKAIALGDMSAVEKLARLVEPGSATPRVVVLLEAAAETGSGAALEWLAEITGDPHALLEAYGKPVETRGDSAAWRFVALHGPENGRIRALRRAAGLMDCNFPSAATMAETHLALGDEVGARKWLEVAEALADDAPPTAYRLAQVILEIEGAGGAARAAAHLERAHAGGLPFASRRLFELSLADGTEAYDPDRARELLASAADTGDGVRVGQYLRGMQKLDVAVGTLETRHAAGRA